MRGIELRELALFGSLCMLVPAGIYFGTSPLDAATPRSVASEVPIPNCQQGGHMIRHIKGHIDLQLSDGQGGHVITLHLDKIIKAIPIEDAPKVLAMATEEAISVWRYGLDDEELKKLNLLIDEKEAEIERLKKALAEEKDKDPPRPLVKKAPATRKPRTRRQ